MQYVPTGPTGLSVVFSGISDGFYNMSKQLMNNITIYEHGSKTWHYQIATGLELPRYNNDTCTVGVREDGQESYEIFMYGGFFKNDESEQQIWDEIWILSIPAFRWFKRPHLPQRGQPVHDGHRRHDPMAPEEGGEPIALFDMNSLSWTDTFSPQSSNYQWPWVVRSWYEANGYNPERWDQPAVRELILNNGSRPSDTSAPPRSSPEPQSPPFTRSPVPIIGSVLAAIAFVALLLLSCVFLRRHGADQNNKGDINADNENRAPGPHELEHKTCVHELEQRTDLTELPGSDSMENWTDSSQVRGEVPVELPADPVVRSP